MFDTETTAALERARARYPVAKAALVPVLHVVQRKLGWITPEAREWVARFLSITPMEVHEVVTFYPMLFDKPVGRHVIHVCRTLSCDACGARELWEHLEQKLGVTRGGTTTDGRFTLLAAECLASCGTAPALLLDGERHENLDAAGVDRLLEATR
ncbi:MAG: NADH-quinone oxidoreductase subunit NuoE [Planctomycetes bacterium]|nr:NADH-quinone oxidoreductase subunit NuoE [Planctomycetota bacterium]